MDYTILDTINSPEDLKQVPLEKMDALAAEIRSFLVEKVSRTGGHLASNLGVVELTLALMLSTDLPGDKIIWDVGHQSYVYKMLTGRKEAFDQLRSYGGLSGFPKRRESEYDAFNTGHSSTSLSAALGIAQAYELEHDDSTVIAVIGDGSVTGGMAFEALNNMAKLKRNLIIVLNDNDMAIAKSVGGMSAYLSRLRAGDRYNDIKLGVVRVLEKIPVLGPKIIRQIKRTKSSLKQLIVPGMVFEDIGITYLGPFDGHNIEKMTEIFREAKKVDRPVVIHVKTVKGKGYGPAERDPEHFHGIGPFDPATGESLNRSVDPTYTEIFSEALSQAAQDHPGITAITAAMPDGTGLSRFRDRFPDRFFDVGIAEEHAVTFAAGMASVGYKPFVAIYSSFLQRAFDQILHDVCIQNLPVTFCIDRAGLVGNDGETHQGTFDISYLNVIPNMNIIAPKNAQELLDAVRFAADFNAPLAIRYPRGKADFTGEEFHEPIVLGRSEGIYLEKDIAIISVGTMFSTSLEVRRRLKEKGQNVTLINARFVKPLDEVLLNDLQTDHSCIITIEENVITGGYGATLLRHMNSIGADTKIINFAVPNMYVEQGDTKAQLRECGLDADSIFDRLVVELGIKED